MTAIQQARHAMRSWAQRIGQVVSLEGIDQGLTGDETTTFAVTTNRGNRFILKNITGKLDATRIETEYNLLRHLEAHNVPVAVRIVTDNGQLYAEDQGQVYLLYPMLPVDYSMPAADIGRVYANIGAAVARLHKALATYPQCVDSWTMDLPRTVFQECIPRILRALTEQDAEAFQRVVAALQGDMVIVLEDLPAQLIHGDCHGGNYLLYRGDVSGFVDLDHLSTGPRVYDIGYLLADMAKAQFFDNHAHQGWLGSFHHVVAGYQRENSLSRQERNALWFVMLATQGLFHPGALCGLVL